jgi:1-deoxy-D-xylulose-5-phosphate synthase
LQLQGITIPVLQLGLPDKFIEQGDHKQMLADCGLDANGLILMIKNKLT